MDKLFWLIIEAHDAIGLAPGQIVIVTVVLMAVLFISMGLKATR